MVVTINICFINYPTNGLLVYF